MNFRKFMHYLLDLNTNIHSNIKGRTFADIYFSKIDEIMNHKYSLESKEIKFINKKEKYIHILLSHKNIDYNSVDFLYNLVRCYINHCKYETLKLPYINFKKETLDRLCDLMRYSDYRKLDKIILFDGINLKDYLHSYIKISSNNSKTRLDLIFNYERNKEPFILIKELLVEDILEDVVVRLIKYDRKYLSELIELNLPTIRSIFMKENVLDILMRTPIDFNIFKIKDLTEDDKINFIIHCFLFYSYNINELLNKLFSNKNLLKNILNKNVKEFEKCNLKNLNFSDCTLLSVYVLKNNNSDHYLNERFLRSYTMDLCYEWNNHKDEIHRLSLKYKIFSKKYKFGISKNIKHLILFGHKDSQSLLHKLPLDIVKYLFKYLYLYT